MQEVNYNDVTGDELFLLSYSTSTRTVIWCWARPASDS